MFITKTKDLPEIQRSLSDVSLFTLKLNDTYSALFIFAQNKDSDRIGKTIRSFDISQIAIPTTFSQNPSEAFRHLTTKIKELTANKKEIDSKILTSLPQGYGRDVESLSFCSSKESET